MNRERKIFAGVPHPRFGVLQKANGGYSFTIMFDSQHNVSKRLIFDSLVLASEHYAVTITNTR